MTQDPFRDTVPTFRVKSLQEQGVDVCPNGCSPPLIWKAVPKPGKNLNAMARCLRCLSYWEVDAEGKIINRRKGEDREILPEGEVPKDIVI